MKKQKTVALVAHDNKKKELLDWVKIHYNKLIKNKIVCTGTTGVLVEKVINKELQNNKLFSVQKVKSGPLGGDQQLGAMIAEEKVDALIFFWDPMSCHVHDVDVKALLRIAVLYNIPTANNVSTADFIVSSPYFGEYDVVIEEYNSYVTRKVAI